MNYSYVNMNSECNIVFDIKRNNQELMIYIVIMNNNNIKDK